MSDDNKEGAGVPVRECGNGECGWKGTTERMLGSVGPLCPRCGETTEPAAPSDAVTEYNRVKQALLILLQEMHQKLELLDQHQPGYQHAKGWNAALVEVMNYVHGEALAAPGAAIAAREQECWACNDTGSVTTSSNGSGLIEAPCEACASRDEAPATPQAAIAAAPSDARKLCDMYQQLAEAMGYHSGEGGMEFSPEEWASALLRDATAFRALTQPTTVQQADQEAK